MTPITSLTRLRINHGHDSMIGARASQAVEIYELLDGPAHAGREGVLRGSLLATLNEIAMAQAGANDAPQVRRKIV